MIPIQTFFFDSVVSDETKGSYILFIILNSDITIKIGSLGKIAFKKGFYLYIGSALGPGGLVPRVERHLRQDKKKFWHIDYLLDSHYSSVVAVAWRFSSQKLECQISQELDLHSNITSMAHFGSSDCKCTGHLKVVQTIDYGDFIHSVLMVIAPFEMSYKGVPKY